jgi:electron transport complex protein RnfD
MTCTLVALAILVAISSFSFGATSIILTLITVSVAISLDYLLSKMLKGKGPVNTLSAAVFGLIVALSYSLGVYTTFTIDIVPLQAPQAYYYAAAIAAVGMIVFKKLQGLTGRKYVNPAAAAKLVVLSPFLYQTFLTPRHLAEIGSLARPIDNIGLSSFGSFLQSCMIHPAAVKIPFSHTYTDIFTSLILQKYHGWIGGVSSLAVIIVGLAVFIICRKSYKWRITLTYLLAVSAMSLIMTGIYGGDALLRIGFELFIGSSIFLAFFMATDPATTPKSIRGQGAFGIGLGVLTVLIQTYMGFFGGSILALVIMNLISSIENEVTNRAVPSHSPLLNVRGKKGKELSREKSPLRHKLISYCHSM